jgi:hypothetical protein
VQTTHPGTIQLDGGTASRVRTSQSSGASAAAGRRSTTPCTRTATSAPQAAGSSPSASTRSDTSTPLRWRARLTQRGSDVGRCLARVRDSMLRRARQAGGLGCCGRRMLRAGRKAPTRRRRCQRASRAPKHWRSWVCHLPSAREERHSAYEHLADLATAGGSASSWSVCRSMQPARTGTGSQMSGRARRLVRSECDGREDGLAVGHDRFRAGWLGGQSASASLRNSLVS